MKTDNESTVPMLHNWNVLHSTDRRRASKNRGISDIGALLVIVVLVVVLVVTAYWGIARWWNSSAPTSFKSQGPTITQVQALGTLVTLKVSVSDILEAHSHSRKGSWLIKGDALIGVDCRDAKVRSRSEEGHTAVIVLPRPSVIQPRVDHSRTFKWDVSREGWGWIPGIGDESAMTDDAMAQAQLLVEEAVKKPEIPKQARQNAELVLSTMYRLVGWEVAVEWSDLPKDATEIESGK